MDIQNRIESNMEEEHKQSALQEAPVEVGPQQTSMAAPLQVEKPHVRQERD